MRSQFAWLRRPRSVVSAIQTVAAIGLTISAIVPVAIVRAKPLAVQPFPDSVEYADGAWQLGHRHGYVTFFDERTSAFGDIARPPRYPFGTSAALAPFAAIIGRFPASIQDGSRFYSVLYVLVLVAAAWRLGGPLAGAVAALLAGASPFAYVSASLILSDALAAMLTVAILLALTFQSRTSAGAAGALTGALVCVRLLGVVSLPAALLAVRGRSRVILAACAAPFIAGLALYQWNTFGSPLRTGYSYWLPELHTFSSSFVLGHTPLNEGPFVYPDLLKGSIFQSLCPCGVGGPMTKLASLFFYPSVAFGLFWVFAPPLAGLIGLVRMVMDRSTEAARFALTTVVLNVAVVLFYFDRAARFVAPAASLLLVYGALGISGLLEQGWRAASGVRGRLLHRSAVP